MDHLLELLDALVAIDTTTRNSNLELIDFVEERLAGLTDTVWRVPDDDGAKAGLIARFGPDTDGGVVLSSHTDCVPVDGQAWSSDPFTVRRDGVRLYGRGTADMKGFLAACLEVAPRLAAADLTAPVWLALSYDEEIGALGAEPLAASLAASGASPQAVIVGEPTSMEIVNAHKGVRAFTFTFTGRSAHSSRPAAGANALAAAVMVGTRVLSLAGQVARVHDPAFDPPYTTFNLAELHGGTAINIVPDRAEVTFEYRPVPADDSSALADEIEAFARDELLAQLRRSEPDADLVVTSPGVLPSLRPEVDGAAERLVRELTGTTVAARSAAFGTDGARFQQHGWSTVVCGPGSIDVAHRPDEHIDLDQLAVCRDMLEALVARYSR
jgi:acetylornithine deacetylase